MRSGEFYRIAREELDRLSPFSHNTKGANK